MRKILAVLVVLTVINCVPGPSSESQPVGTAGEPITEAQTVAQGSRYAYYSFDGQTVTVQPIGTFTATVGGVWTTVRSTTPMTFAVGSMIPTARYYVYAAAQAGATVYSVATDPPDANLGYRSTSTDYRFVGTIVADRTGAVVPQVCSRGRCRYSALTYALDDLTVVHDVARNAWAPILHTDMYPSFATGLTLAWELVPEGQVLPGDTAVGLRVGAVMAPLWVSGASAFWTNTSFQQTSGSTAMIGELSSAVVPGTVPQFYAGQAGGNGGTTVNMWVSGFEY